MIIIKRNAILLAMSLALFATSAHAQNCTPGQVAIRDANNVWTCGTATKNTVGLNNVDNTSDASKPVSTAQQAAITTAAANATIPAGLIVISLTTCPAAFTEVLELNGKTLIGTVVANGNVNTTGGSDTVTPAGTNSAPTFTGSALATHTHTFTGSAATAASTTASPKLVTANTSTGVATVTTATGTNSAVSAGTPAGTVSAPVFTGSALDNRSAFIRVIFCQKQ